MKLRPYSATILALGVIILMGLGTYFVFMRPPLLPEDPRYMGTSLSSLQVTGLFRNLCENGSCCFEEQTNPRGKVILVPLESAS